MNRSRSSLNGACSFKNEVSSDRHTQQLIRRIFHFAKTKISNCRLYFWFMCRWKQKPGSKLSIYRCTARYWHWLTRMPLIKKKSVNCAYFGINDINDWLFLPCLEMISMPKNFDSFRFLYWSDLCAVPLFRFVSDMFDRSCNWCTLHVNRSYHVVPVPLMNLAVAFITHHLQTFLCRYDLISYIIAFVVRKKIVFFFHLFLLQSKKTSFFFKSFPRIKTVCDF